MRISKIIYVGDPGVIRETYYDHRWDVIPRVGEFVKFPHKGMMLVEAVSYNVSTETVTVNLSLNI
jgi:hypothetical protein